MPKKRQPAPEEDQPKKKNEENEAENKIIEKEENSDENESEKKEPLSASGQQTLIAYQEAVKREISQEMEESYLDYAMSVIVSRALPDVRDGLKPVHRRILFAMHELGLRSGGSFRKSAMVVGEVIGKYHPHGDMAVYDALVRLAQEFSMRYTLVRGQGNFGSIDGDSPAAMRYTECKMEKMAEEMLSDIEKEVVDWQANYDGRIQEPKVLPTKIPQLLLNGTSGIAVGMATSVPPHNLGELVDGIIHLCDNPDATIEDLMEFIKGPDFPTHGLIYDIEAIKSAYMTGRGGVVMRARAEIVEKKNGKYAIIVTEIPYQVNKANLVMKIAELVREKKIIGVTDIRDESNRHGIRIVIELKKDSYPKKILNQLYKMTALQESFNFNMIALVDGLQPRLLNLKEVLEFFIIHRKEVITRRTQFELKVAKERAHILEGYVIALDHIDAVIETIRKSETKEDAHTALMKKFKLTDIQAKAILEMRLQTLAGLERQKILDEYKEKLALIKELESILKDAKKVAAIMKKELADLKAAFGDKRKTEIVPHAVDEISAKDTIPNERMIVMLTKENYIKRMPPSSFRSQNRGGKGIIGATTKDEDEIKIIRAANTHDELLFFANTGRVFKQTVYEIPVGSRTAKGQPIVNFLQLRPEEFVTAMTTTGEQLKGEFLFMATRYGTVKKTLVEEFKNIRKNGLIAIKLREGDSLEWVREVWKGNQVMMVTKNGKGIRFNEKDVREIGRASMGVRGIRVKKDDQVVQMDIVTNPESAELFVIMENGLGKCTGVTGYRLQNRGGGGVKTANITKKTGCIVGAHILDGRSHEDLILVSREGQLIRLPVEQIPSRGRATQGVYLMRMNENDKVASMSIIMNEEPAGQKEESKEEAEQESQEKLVQT